MAIPKRSLDKAIQDIISRIYGGNDSGVKDRLKSAITRSILEGRITPDTRSAISPYVSSGAEDIEREILDANRNEYTFSQDPNKYVKDYLGKLAPKDISAATDDELTKYLEGLNEATSLKSYSRPTSYSDVIGGPGGVGVNYTESPLNFEYGDEIKTVQDILGTRAEKANREASLSSFIQGVPEQQRVAREDYLSGLEGSLRDQFENDRIPRDLQSLNTRGLLDSPGEVADALSTGAFDIQSTIEQARIELEQQDYQFFYDMAYQDQLRKSLDAAKDYQATLSSERDKLRVDQENRFQSTENAINRDFNFKLQDIQYKQQLNAQEIRAKRQRDAQESAKRSQLYSQAGSAAGAIGGAAVGGPAGATVGASVGSGAGYLD